jgi:hypothetical protein
MTRIESRADQLERQGQQPGQPDSVVGDMYRLHVPSTITGWRFVPFWHPRHGVAPPPLPTSD